MSEELVFWAVIWIMPFTLGALISVASAYNFVVLKLQYTRWSELPKPRRLLFRIPSTELSSDEKKSRIKNASLFNTLSLVIMVAVSLSGGIDSGDRIEAQDVRFLFFWLIFLIGGWVIASFLSRRWLARRWAPNHLLPESENKIEEPDS